MDSEPGQGTTFEVFLPRATAVAHGAVDAPRGAVGPLRIARDRGEHLVAEHELHPGAGLRALARPAIARPRILVGMATCGQAAGAVVDAIMDKMQDMLLKRMANCIPGVDSIGLVHHAEEGVKGAPMVPIVPGVRATNDIAAAVCDADFVLMAVPSQHSKVRPRSVMCAAFGTISTIVRSACGACNPEAARRGGSANAIGVTWYSTIFIAIL